MIIQNNYNLTELNTFRISAKAKYFVELINEAEIPELFDTEEFKNSKKLFLGGGSNVLFTKDFDGIVILNKLKGTEVLSGDNENVLVRSMGGEMWHDFVLFAVDHELWGVENLAFIPGTVGASPMQNIGAYGVELKDVLESVETFDIKTGEKRIFNKEECKLGYRESIFKNEVKGKYFISAVTFRLSKIPKINISYKILQEYLSKNKVEVKSPKDVSNAVEAIRRSKLPDPKVIGNAGSFFKNVFLSAEEFTKVQKKYPEMPFFEEETSDAKNGSKASVFVKIPAGWLIEQCGWKGKRVGNVGVHEKQALVLINHGGAKGEELLNMANDIIASVKAKFGLDLVPEVNLY